MLDFKIAQTQYDDSGNVSSQIVRYYEGVITEELEPVLDALPSDELIPITRYRRGALIEEIEYTYEAI